MITHAIIEFSELRAILDENVELKKQIVEVQRRLDLAVIGSAEWSRLYGEAKKHENTWSGADADLCRRLTAENKALRDKQDDAALALWRAEALAQTVAANHEREVQGLKYQIESRQSDIDRISERRDFWYNRAQNDGREHAQAIDRLAKTDATLMELCQLLGLDPTGDVVAEMRARMAAKETEHPKPKSPNTLPALEPGACVARRCRVEAVIGDIALFDDGIWANASEWTPANFLPDTTEDDIPF